MGEKDITEKILLTYNDVFADIVNVLLFDGDQLVRPEDLEDQSPYNAYKADGKIRDIDRDVAKRWIRNRIRMIGREEGLEKGADRAFTLMQMLFADARSDDAVRAANDKEYARQLMKEYKLV